MTTTIQDPITLRCAGKYTMEEAQLVLTIGEVNAVQRHFGQEIGQGLFGMELVSGVIWALERRAALAADEKLVSWAEVDALPLGALNDYFIPDEVEVDPDAPEGESGKGSTPSA